MVAGEYALEIIWKSASGLSSERLALQFDKTGAIWLQQELETY